FRPALGITRSSRPSPIPSRRCDARFGPSRIWPPPGIQPSRRNSARRSAKASPTHSAMRP
ncbi:MAG: hypothetical protein AVDCRST_MAG31-220, partial [uncultured Sphingomonas sp.]